MKLQIEKGLFRLWIVLSVIWISVILFKSWNDYKGTSDAYIERWDEEIKNAFYASELPLIEEDDVPNKEVFITAKDLRAYPLKSKWSHLSGSN